LGSVEEKRAYLLDLNKRKKVPMNILKALSKRVLGEGK